MLWAEMMIWHHDNSSSFKDWAFARWWKEQDEMRIETKWWQDEIQRDAFYNDEALMKQEYIWVKFKQDLSQI